MDGEHWLGLENIYNLGKQDDYKLLVELEDWMGKKVYAAYSSFHLEPERQAYRLRLGSYQGNAGDSLTSNNGKPFTTLDHDHDAFSGAFTRHTANGVSNQIHAVHTVTLTTPEHPGWRIVKSCVPVQILDLLAGCGLRLYMFVKPMRSFYDSKQD